jgi:hypothetical protein
VLKFQLLNPKSALHHYILFFLEKGLGYRHLKMIICQPCLQDVSILQAVTLRKMKYFQKKSCISTFCQSVLKEIDWHACSFDLPIQAIEMSDYVGLEASHFSALPVFKMRSQSYSKHHRIEWIIQTCRFHRFGVGSSFRNA